WLLNAQPMRIWLQAHHHLPIVGELLQAKPTAYVFSWLGCLYDLLIVFLLLNPSSRKLAYFTVVVFHLLTWLLFPIGIFPWMMIFSTLIFFDTQWHQRILNRFDLKSTNTQTAKLTLRPNKSNFAIFFVIVFVFFQIAVPFRYLLYPGNLFWTEEGFRFSWRVMLMHKEGLATFYVKDGPSQRKMEIDASKYLSRSQYNQMATQPDFLLQFAKFLKTEFENRKLTFGKNEFQLKNISVHANVYVSLNGRNSRKFVDEKHNLCQIPYNLKHRTWIEPFE
ncbi:MAG: HTTM domain-containing protein, partial [Bacteroidetes bacterium]|nr:HTTM domain-containing protein [Bacteroidota bacterium]